MLTDQEELGAWLRLGQTPGVGSETTRKLLLAFGTPQGVWAHSASAWRGVVSARVAQAMSEPPPGWAALVQSTWAWLQQAPQERAIVTLGDADYPPALLETADPPVLLYALGRIAHLPRLQASAALAMVGSRNPTPQGRLNAQAFARSLAQAGLCIVSGLALGVDGAAHQGALEAGSGDSGESGNADAGGAGNAGRNSFANAAPASTGQGGAGPDAPLRTVAVVGTGLDRVYPKQHLSLARQIAQQGLILSEYPLGTPPLAENFPRRNRIISGLSQGTLVVEAALESGSLITARQALEQGREVFAIPGSIHAPQSRGCHALIRQGAKLVESAQDVLEELRSPDPFAQVPVALGATKHRVGASAVPGSNALPQSTATAATAAQAVTAPDQPVQADGPHGPVLALLGHDPLGLDALQVRSGQDTASLLAALLDLELSGHIQRLPGGLFQRVVRV